VDRHFWTGIVYFVGLYLQHVAWWRALIVAFAMATCWYLTYGRRIVVSVGLAILLLGMGSWSGLFPEPSDLSDFVDMQRFKAQ
jgi:hypothetical protein